MSLPFCPLATPSVSSGGSSTHLRLQILQLPFHRGQLLIQGRQLTPSRSFCSQSQRHYELSYRWILNRAKIDNGHRILRKDISVQQQQQHKHHKHNHTTDSDMRQSTTVYKTSTGRSRRSAENAPNCGISAVLLSHRFATMLKNLRGCCYVSRLLPNCSRNSYRRRTLRANELENCRLSQSACTAIPTLRLLLFILPFPSSAPPLSYDW